VLPIPNTASRGGYHQLCRDRDVARHPAAMPEPLVEFFVRFLTDPGDVVLDPFAGSNTTGSVAERLGREWVGIEADADYAAASRVRFDPAHETPRGPTPRKVSRTASGASRTSSPGGRGSDTSGPA
jgi:site-specific DNA-methyltransferase (cytosine-N4-specific)